MFIQISIDGSLSLHETDDFKRFSIVDRSSNHNHAALLKISEPVENNHFWLRAEAVIALSGRSGDVDWVTRFGDMLTTVEPYGYANLKENRIKAHLELGE